MVKEVSGIPLTSFEDPIHHALTRITTVTDGRISFEDTCAATRLELKENNRYSAASKTTVKVFGEAAGDLHILAFAPFDGTGDETDFKLDNIDPGFYPYSARVVPRLKTGVHTEAHIAISVHDVYSDDSRLFIGNLAVLGLRVKNDPTPQLVKLGEVGRYDSDEFPLPQVTATVGYLNHQGHWTKSEEGRRFGDPHAIYNPWPDMVQICGFFAVKQGDPETHLKSLGVLGMSNQHSGDN